MLPLCAATLVGVVALSCLVWSQSTKMDDFLKRAPHNCTMPEIPPDQCTISEAWCTIKGEPPRHQRIDVATEHQLNPLETEPQHDARHDVRVANKEITHPRNCEDHQYP